jgi:hypothetical protein
MYGYGHLAADGRVDMLFVAFVSVSILIWIYAASRKFAEDKTLRDIGHLPYFCVGLFSGLAILTKGPLGLVLPGLVIGCTALYYGGWRSALSLVKPGWFVAPLVAVPWYYMAAQSGSSSGSFVKRQIFFENIDRFFGSAGIPDKPFWYYLEHFWSQAAPWSLVFGLIVVSLIELRMKRLNLSDFLGNSASKRFVFDASLIWVFSSLVLFSLSSGKRRGYLLAILPPVAVVVVLGAPLAFWAFKRLAEALKCKGLSEPWSFRAWIALHFVTACSGAFVIGISCFDSAPVGAISEEKWAVVAMLPQVLGERALSLGFVVLLLGCLSLYCFKLGQTKRQGILTLCALVCYLQIILIGFVGSGLALKGEVHAYRDFAQEIAELTEGVERLRFIKERRDESFDCFFFYFKRRILLHDPNMLLEADEMYLSRTARFEQLEIPQHMKAEIVARGGRFVDEPEEEIVLFKLHSIPS